MIRIMPSLSVKRTVTDWAGEVFIDVFSVADLCHQDHKGVIMNFINDAVKKKKGGTDPDLSLTKGQ